MGHFEQALRIKPYIAVTHYNLGTALKQVGRVQEAIGQYEQALRIKPDYAEAYNNLGNTLWQAGKLEDAIANYEQALRLKPDYAEAHYSLGLASEQMGKLSEAIWHYERVLRITPDSAEAQNNLAWLLATRTPAEGGDPLRAVTHAQRACELTGNGVAPYLDTLAAAYASAGRFSDAIATGQKAAELARTAGQPQMVREIEAHLELYRAGRPYRLPVDRPRP